jgi:hypothetical protein
MRVSLSLLNEFWRINPSLICTYEPAPSRVAQNRHLRRRLWWMSLYSPLREWRSCVCIWHEMLLRRSVNQLCVELDEEFMLIIPCVGLGRCVTEAEVQMLACLIGRWKVGWKGLSTLSAMETTGRSPRRNSVHVSRRDGGVYVVGESFCVRDSSIILFDEPMHMRLYLEILNRKLHPSLFCSLCSALAIESSGRCTDVRLHRFSDECAHRLRSPFLWKRLAEMMWPCGVEIASMARWRAERCQGVDSVESMVHSVVVLDEQLKLSDPIVLIERDAQGRHRRCLLIMVRASQWRENAGSILLISYVGVEARFGDD